MYKDTYQSRHRSLRRRRRLKRRRQFCRMITPLVSLVLLLTVTIGGTIAYIITHKGPVENTFNPSKVACEVEEKFENDIKSNVAVKNTGDTDAYIRAAIVVNWVDDDGNVLAEAPVRGTDYTLTLATDTGWDIGTSDGYYYYTSSIAPEASTGVLISSCKPETTKDGYHLSVEILAEAIQSSPAAAVKQCWGVTVADDGTISK